MTAHLPGLVQAYIHVYMTAHLPGLVQAYMYT